MPILNSSQSRPNGLAARRFSAPRATGRGTRLVIGLLALGLAAAATGIWFQWQQTRRCLDFYGATAARRISAAPTVELWTLVPGSHPGRLRAFGRRDVSQARGLVHLRRGLVEDANFEWDASSGATGDLGGRLPDEAWTFALAFTDPAHPGGAATVVAFSVAADGASPSHDGGRAAMAVVGRPGRVALGRIAAGLQRWVAATLGQVDDR